MRAKNEFKFLAEAYDTKLILERVVDGKLMCPEACCGAPVVECTCGPDCPHCNCFMIHKAMKEKGFTNKLLKEGIVPKDNRDEPIRKRDKEEDYERFQNPYDDYVDDDAREQARRDDELMGDIKVDHDSIPKRPDLEKMQMRMVALDKEIEKAQSRKREDNEEPKRGITGLNPRRSPELHSMKSHAIDKIDLNKWREYPAEDVMKAVYRRYGKELPSVDSYDWAITWDKKVRPWLKENEGNL